MNKDKMISGIAGPTPLDLQIDVGSVKVILQTEINQAITNLQVLLQLKCDISDMAMNPSEVQRIEDLTNALNTYKEENDNWYEEETVPIHIVSNIAPNLTEEKFRELMNMEYIEPEEKTKNSNSAEARRRRNHKGGFPG